MANIPFNEVGFQQVVKIIEGIAERVEELGTAASDNKSDGATPRILSPELEAFAKANPGVLPESMDDKRPVDDYVNTTGVFVYDVRDRDIATAHVDRDSGLKGFWVQSKSGKRFLVDIMGVGFFLYNPLREEAYEKLAAHS